VYRFPLNSPPPPILRSFGGQQAVLDGDRRRFEEIIREVVKRDPTSTFNF
jgi:hypothetical protein